MEPSDRDELIRRIRPGLLGSLWFSGNAGAVQGFAPRWAAGRSTWNHSRGWQREIALRGKPRFVPLGGASGNALAVAFLSRALARPS
jgi:hypothetical protein